MAEVIDLDFYRKFRIILPVRSRSLVRKKSLPASRTAPKQYRRRRHLDPDPKIKQEE